MTTDWGWCVLSVCSRCLYVPDCDTINVGGETPACVLSQLVFGVIVLVCIAIVSICLLRMCTRWYQSMSAKKWLISWRIHEPMLGLDYVLCLWCINEQLQGRTSCKVNKRRPTCPRERSYSRCHLCPSLLSSVSSPRRLWFWERNPVVFTYT